MCSIIKYQRPMMVSCKASNHQVTYQSTRNTTVHKCSSQATMTGSGLGPAGQVVAVAYGPNTFSPNRISKLTMVEIGTTFLSILAIVSLMAFISMPTSEKPSLPTNVTILLVPLIKKESMTLQ